MWEFASKHEIVVLSMFVAFMWSIQRMFKFFVNRNNPATKCMNYEIYHNLSDREDIE